MEETLRALTDRVNQLARAYYVEDAPQVSDGEYDALFDQLLELEKEAGYSLPDSPTRRVGGEPLTAFCPIPIWDGFGAWIKCEPRTIYWPGGNGSSGCLPPQVHRNQTMP